MMDPGVPLDDATFSDLVRRHRDGLIAQAYRMSGDRELAEDAVAETFARIWRRRYRITMENPPAYLTRAVRNEVVDRFRAAGRERSAIRRSVVAVGEVSDGRDAVEARAILDGLVSALPEHHRRTVSLRYLADLSESETAAALSLPVGTVKSHASRAIRRMRQAVLA